MGANYALPEGCDQFAYVEEYLAEARTGDIILFAGVGPISEVVRIGTQDEEGFSHVGVVVRQNMRTRPCLFHSFNATLWTDVITGEKKRGPQLNDLGDVLNHYGGYKICVRKLHTGRKRSEARRTRAEWTEAVVKLYEETRSLPYEQDYGEMLKSVMRLNEENNFAAYFCVELVAHAYQRMGILSSQGFPLNNYTLTDFTDRVLLPLERGARLGEQVYFV
jgi:hypothetical protein